MTEMDIGKAIGLIGMVLVIVLIVWDGRRGSDSWVNKSSHLGPNCSLPPWRRKLLLVLGTVIPLLFVLFKLMGKIK